MPTPTPDRAPRRASPVAPDRGGQWRQQQADAAADAAAETCARARPVFRDRASYLAAHPEGAIYLWGEERERPVVLVPLLHEHRWGHLPGGYLLAAAITSLDGAAHWVGVYDNDDGELRRPCVDRAEALRVLDELATLGPVDPDDLVTAWGFQWG